jgi:hypothetical protein
MEDEGGPSLNEDSFPELVSANHEGEHPYSRPDIDLPDHIHRTGLVRSHVHRPVCIWSFSKSSAIAQSEQQER